MDMIRWLASNIVVQVAWGLGLLAVLLAFLFGGTKSADEHAATTETPVAVEEVVSTEVVAEPVAVAQTAVATAAVATVAAVATATEEVAPVETVTEAIDTVVVEVPVAEEVVVEEVATTEEAATSETTEVATAEVETTVEETAAVEEAVLDTGSIEGKSSEDILMMAREAYWNNGLDEAAQLYGVLIDREPTVIEHKGELGNVLWKQGYPSKAAELYAEIAQPMIEKGNGERVSNMVGFIGLFYPERAATIRELLAAN